MVPFNGVALISASVPTPASQGPRVRPGTPLHAVHPLPTGDPSLDANPFFVARIQEAVTRDFTARGIEPVESDPSLLVNVVDAETLRIVWRGWARADVTRALENTAVLERLVQEAARAMFREFPRDDDAAAKPIVWGQPLGRARPSPIVIAAGPLADAR
jgi:hypothetical protein